MTHSIKYAVFRYSPSIVSGETINLGLLVTETLSKRMEFHYTTKWDRIQSFDDSLNIEGLKIALADMKNDIEKPLYHSSKGFSIENFIRGFANELHFSAPYQLECENVDDKINELRKIYLRFDYKVKDRLKPNDEIKFLQGLLKGTGVKYSRNFHTHGKFGVPISYDLVFSNYGVRYIRFEDKDISRMFNSLKAWAWDSSHDPYRSTIYIFSPDGKDPDNIANLKKAKAILKDASENVFSIEDPQIGDMFTKLNEASREFSLLPSGE